MNQDKKAGLSAELGLVKQSHQKFNPNILLIPDWAAPLQRRLRNVVLQLRIL